MAEARSSRTLIATENEAAIVGGDGVDEHFGALCHFDGLGSRDFALIVFAVADDDDGFADGAIGMLAQELFFAGLVDGVIEGSAAAIAETLNAGGELGNAVGEILRQMALFIKADDKGLVVAGADDVLEKTGGGFFLEGETALHGTADIHEQAEFDGQVGFGTESQDGFAGL